MNTAALLKQAKARVKDCHIPDIVIALHNETYGLGHDTDFNDAVLIAAAYEAGRLAVLEQLRKSEQMVSHYDDEWVIVQDGDVVDCNIKTDADLLRVLDGGL